MAIQQPEQEHSNPDAEEVRDAMISRVREESVEGVDQSHDAGYIAVLNGGEFDSIVYESGGPRVEEAVTMLTGADAAFHAAARGEKLSEAQFAEDESQDTFTRLFDEAMGDVQARREGFGDLPNVSDYTPRQRAVLAAGTALQRKVNPLGGLLAALGGR